MRFLITGITGFNGPHLAKALIEDGHEVFGTYRDGSKLDIDDVLKDEIYKIAFVGCDLNSPFNVEKVFMKTEFDGVFHLAAFTHPSSSFKAPMEVLQVNTLGTAAIVEAIRKHQPNCVLLNCSTSEVYGIQEAGTMIDETFLVNPINPYGVSKACADLYVLERARNNMVRAFITRAFSHTGERRRPNYAISSDAIQIAKIIRRKQEPIIKVGNLKSIRSVIDVKEVVYVYQQLMYKMLEGSMNNGELFIVGGGEPRTIGNMLHIMLSLFNVEAELEPDPNLFRKVDIPSLIPDSTKVRKFLNWSPQIPLENTLERLVNYWLERV